MTQLSLGSPREISSGCFCVVSVSFARYGHHPKSSSLSTLTVFMLLQEAFKAVEDIHGLITLSKKQPKPSLMANYYQKLGLVFAKSGNHLFHASTLHRLFNLSREQRKNLSTDELQRSALLLVVCFLWYPLLIQDYFPKPNPKMSRWGEVVLGDGTFC